MKKTPVKTYDNPFEAFKDIGAGVAEGVVDALNPLSPLLRSERTVLPDAPARSAESEKANKNHTPLDLANLEKQYGKQDSEKYQKAAALHHFKRFKSSEMQAISDIERERQEKAKKETEDAQNKQHADEGKKPQEQTGEEPHGKIKPKWWQPQHRKATTGFENKGQFGR
ncbi:hypothetical protein A3F03_00165 [Candidatus Roizmanbacteria bacterium RIFCSPHIGHO2_12_FULL_41_11]|uniref:Uncharacterized protein n=3 Tax=Candidatus Roizmaniibacteriota TaxID=1752723 RepID=A0A1F7JRT8_9BACT|nr:MAG: hypothetical protein A3F03_00165 [Candidatus Roizmanbacteria bacterium RIFCSPHIGHO2_12_FULL_41_11]OGK52382.1 MAG: hypothetical protein A2966_01800 [Candidatus Roizmanbacteria bacterium RIFCSPLOWO2_01_FULL_41_22]OGK58281.1 MAG: hypothetical protein A3H86_01445 [Candidatus Roizmanbacteria bacterium RIFCSPLOWO2_02_FULL_41_9]